MKSILILEGNTSNLVDEVRRRVGVSPAENYGNALKSQGINISYKIVAPYDNGFQEEDLDDVDAVVLTGSGVPWSVDAPEAAPLRLAVTKVFDSGLSVLASCNGMQLAAVLLGGEVGVSPKGMEIGLALNINRTPAGKKHALLKGREDSYTVPCVHRDEVQRLPEKASLLAGNAHSPVQAFAYECDGINFWGTQYHPEFSAAWVADLLRAPGTIWQDSAKANALDIADTDQEAAQALGVYGNDLMPEVRMTELRNWLIHISQNDL